MASIGDSNREMKLHTNIPIYNYILNDFGYTIECCNN